MSNISQHTPNTEILFAKIWVTVIKNLNILNSYLLRLLTLTKSFASCESDLSQTMVHVHFSSDTGLVIRQTALGSKSAPLTSLDGARFQLRVSYSATVSLTLGWVDCPAPAESGRQ